MCFFLCVYNDAYYVVLIIYVRNKDYRYKNYERMYNVLHKYMNKSCIFQLIFICNSQWCLQKVRPHTIFNSKYI